MEGSEEGERIYIDSMPNTNTLLFKVILLIPMVHTVVDQDVYCNVTGSMRI